ncbi:MAG: hypothetical protein IPJ79_17590 [Bacteroidetes bacterium]|nr:hypothetical protein [Bacteroidota bacterium]
MLCHLHQSLLQTLQPFVRGNVLLTANTHPNISSYQWKLNGNNITGATNSNFTATAVGGYTVTINYSCGAVSTSPTTTVTIANSFTPVVLSNGPAFKCDNSSALLETQIEQDICINGIWVLTLLVVQHL